MPQATVCGTETGTSASACTLSRQRLRSRSSAPRFGLERRSDAALVALAKSGSEGAYEEILRRYRRQLHSYCAQMLGPSRAEDAVQQAFLQAFIALQRNQDREINLRPWLYRISHNCSIDMLRKNGWDYDELDPEYDGVAQPPQLLEQKEDLAKVVGAMRALPERQRRALTLRELEGRSYREIGAELGHSDAGVRQLIFRARSALRGGVGAIALPIGALRARIGQHFLQLTDGHQMAFATSVGSEPAAAGIAKASAVFVAGLSLLAAGAPHQPSHASEPDSGRPVAATVDVGTPGIELPGVASGRVGTPGKHPSVTRPVHLSGPGVRPIGVAPVTSSPVVPVVAPVAQPQPQAEALARDNAVSGRGPAGPAPGGNGPSKGASSDQNGAGKTTGGKASGGQTSGGKTPSNSVVQPVVGGHAPKSPNKLSAPKSATKLSAPKSTPKLSAPKSTPKLSAPKSTTLKSTTPKSTATSKPSSSSGSASSKPVGTPNPTPQTGSPGPAKGQNPTKVTGHSKGPASGKGSPASSR